MGNVVAASVIVGLVALFLIALIRDIRQGLWARGRGATYASSDTSSPGSVWSSGSGSWTGDSCSTGGDGGSCGGDGGGGGGGD